LQFAVSLVFVYLLLSALSSAIQEIVANLAKWRANTLETAITNMLGDSGFKDKIYQHVLLKGIWRPNWLFMEVEKIHKPAYISSSMFAQVVQDLRTAPGAALPGVTQKVLDAVVKGAANAEEEKKKIEHWFDDAMDGVSGWYKRKANAWLWVISALVCVALNADTISVGKILWNDPTVREAMSDAAKNYANHKFTETDAGAATPAEIKDELSKVTKARDSLEKLPVPLGWCEDDCLPDDPRRPPTEAYPILLKLIGLLITVLAVSQGAPFWFDLLQKAVNLRLAGDLPPDSRAQS
jgi:hypothetical protein